MPLHLPPERSPGSHPACPGARRPTRRAFLAGVLAGSASAFALRLERPAQAAEEAQGPRAWALLADTHIDALASAENQGQLMAANLLQAAAEVLKARATTALINGDLARTEGQAEDYQTFLGLVAPWSRAGIPVHATLGNHDHRERFLEALGARAGLIRSPAEDGRGPAPKYCSTALVDGTEWLLLDSLDSTNSTPGVLGGAQLAWVEATLDARHEAPAIIFVHHNPETSSQIGLAETERLLAILRPRGRVKAVFFGHTHTWRRWEDDGIHMVNLPAVAYAFNKEEPLGWVLATPRSGGLDLELRSFAPHADQGKRIPLQWRPAGSRVRSL